MKLRCKKCGTEISFSQEVTASPDARVECPGCHARYRLKPRRKKAPGATETASDFGSGDLTASGLSSAGPAPAQAPGRAAAATAAPRGVGTARPATTGDPGRTTPLPRPSRIGPEQPTAVASRPATTAATPPAPTSQAVTVPPPVTGAPTPTGGATSPGSIVFGPGDVLAERYRIVRFLAQGGMGEVYEAEDLELHEHVALKTISAHSSAGSSLGSATSVVERFKREIFLARKVTHPNVCRIFDLGQHRAVGDGGTVVTFLTMELLRGETLSSRLRDSGRMTTAEALPVARQVAAALDAAHRARVIHRDLKSENVFLVEEDDGTTRAVVTDFGIARGAETDRFAATMTGGGIVGTPAYMAPEQVQGKPVTSATDVYAFGVVLYEMVTARLPFESDNPLTTAVKRLQEPPAPPRIHVPDLDARWEKTILRCLEREPADRFQRTAEILEFLVDRPARQDAGAGSRSSARTAVRIPVRAVAESPAASPATGGPAPAATRAAPVARRQRALLAALAVVVLLSAGLVLFNRWKKGRAPEFSPRRSVAVLGFKNGTGQPEVAWMATALAEMLGTELSRDEQLRTIPGDRVADVHKELALDDVGNLGRDDLPRVHSILGCDFVVLGTYVSIGDQIRLDLRLDDAAVGDTLARLGRDGNSADLFAIVRGLGEELRRTLGLKAAGDDARSGLPSDSEANRLFAEALDLIREHRPGEARDRLQEAARIEPENPLVHSVLAEAWEASGYGSRAAEEARKALELAAGLPREDRLLIEGQHYETESDWPAAARTYGRLWELFPDNLEYGLRLVRTETSAGDLEAALFTLDQLRGLPPPSSEDPRIDLAEARLAGTMADFRRQLDAATRAADRAEEVGARLLVARARLLQSYAQRYLAETEAALSSAEAALAIYEDLQHAAGSALALTTLANAHYQAADMDEAVTLYRRALEGYRQIDDQGGLASTLNNLGLVLKKRGDLDPAWKLYQEAEKIQQATDDRRGQANTINNRAAILLSRGELDRARQEFERARGMWKELEDRSGRAYGLHNVAFVLRLAGELENSRAMNEEALSIRREMGQKIGEVASLSSLGGVLLDLGELGRAEKLLTESLDLARKMGLQAAVAQALFEIGELRRVQGRNEEALLAHEEALETRRGLGERLAVTNSEIAVAHLMLAKGSYLDAEVRARVAAGACQREGRRAEEAWATTVQALGLLGQDRLDEAAASIERAEELAEELEHRGVALRVALAAARIAAARGRTGPALALLTETERTAATAGYTELRLEAALAQAEIERSTGISGNAVQRLVSLAEEADVLGFAGLSQRAEAGLGG